MNSNLERLRVNVEEVKRRIAEAAARAGRLPADITLVAVSKTVGAETVAALIEMDVQHIGENRVPDAAAKKDICANATRARWHMIGHLQRNKVKEALSVFDFFHSIDSLRLAREISKRAIEPVPILLEVNVSGEESKYGFSSESLAREIAELTALENLRIEGLMTMAPFTDDMSVCRACFRKLRELAERLRGESPETLVLPHLSMGMTNDFEVAVEEGATLVRIGSALFQGIAK